MVEADVEILMSDDIFLSGTQEPQMKDLILIKVTEWHELGLQLGVDDAELEEIEKNNCMRGPQGLSEEYVQSMGSESPPSPFYQQLVEACETVVAALPVCTCSWDTLHSLSLVPSPPGTRLSFSNGGRGSMTLLLRKCHC